MSRRFWLWVVIIGMVLVCSTCAALTAREQLTARAEIEQMHADGHLSDEGRAILIKALDNAGGFDWSTFSIVGLNVLFTLVGAPAVVRLQRGPATQRVGLPANMIRTGE